MFSIFLAVNIADNAGKHFRISIEITANFSQYFYRIFQATHYLNKLNQICMRMLISIVQGILYKHICMCMCICVQIHNNASKQIFFSTNIIILC